MQNISQAHANAYGTATYSECVCVCIPPAAHMYRVCKYAVCVCVWVIYRKKKRDNMERREMSGGQESGEWKAEKKMN